MSEQSRVWNRREAGETSRRCSKCKRELPANGDHFGSHKKTRDGFHPWCRECSRADSQRRRAENPGTARSYYERNRAVFLEKSGRRARELRFGDHRNEHLAYWAAYREKNRERVRLRQREYDARNRERNRERYHTYYSDPARRAAKNLVNEEWRRANRERARCYVRNRRASIRNSGGSHSKADIDILWMEQGECCSYCCQPLIDYHVDHIVPVSRGGVNGIENLCLACPPCNQRKGSKTGAEFLAADTVEKLHGRSIGTTPPPS